MTGVRGRRLAWLTAAAAVVGAALGVPVGLDRAAGPPPSLPASAVDYDVARDDPAPGLAGATLNRARFDLTDWRGQVVVVGAWASWCAPCRTELPLLADASSRWSPHGVRVVTLNVRDDAEAARALLAEVGAAHLPAVVDRDGALAAAWGVNALPETLLVDRTGRIRLQRFGPLTSGWLDGQIRTLLAS